MSSGTIFHVDLSGNLSRMSPSAPPNEDHMQQLVARYPELITDQDGDLLLIRREQPIADSAVGTGRWSMDHLFVTRNAVPVLVELKRAVDTRLRREVVGQLLDYAANGVAYWQPGRIAASFATTCEAVGADPEQVLTGFLGGGQAIADDFWNQIDSNFQAGRIKLVFVADTIPPELARIVEFLNEQMKADVRAVELNWFEGGGGTTTLVPRVIGETQRAVVQKAARSALPPVTIDEWIEQHFRKRGNDAVDGAHAYVELIRMLGGEPEVAKMQGSIVGTFTGEDGKPFYPLHLWWEGGNVSLSFGYLTRRPGLADESDRRRFYDDVVEVVGPLSTTNLTGFPGFKVALLADGKLRETIVPVLSNFIDRARLT